MTTRLLYQSDASYQRTLAELRSRAERGIKLSYYDDDSPGAKSTECTLGLCDRSIQKMQDGIYRTDAHHCPHDRRFFTVEGAATKPDNDSGSGCFWTCRIFKGDRTDRRTAISRILAVTVEIQS